MAPMRPPVPSCPGREAPGSGRFVFIAFWRSSSSCKGGVGRMSLTSRCDNDQTRAVCLAPQAAPSHNVCHTAACKHGSPTSRHSGALTLLRPKVELLTLTTKWQQQPLTAHAKKLDRWYDEKHQSKAHLALPSAASGLPLLAVHRQRVRVLDDDRCLRTQGQHAERLCCLCLAIKRTAQHAQAGLCDEGNFRAPGSRARWRRAACGRRP